MTDERSVGKHMNIILARHMTCMWLSSFILSQNNFAANTFLQHYGLNISVRKGKERKNILFLFSFVPNLRSSEQCFTVYTLNKLYLKSTKFLPRQIHTVRIIFHSNLCNSFAHTLHSVAEVIFGE
jgi:hypothetical protein